MKKIKILLLLVITFIPLLFVKEVNAFTPLDRITDYTITVTSNDDATLEMKYEINWTVLSDSEGALEWVKIGVPNRFVSNIKTSSSNVSDVSYYHDSGAYIRVDFNTKYHKGDSLSFNFSFHQDRIFSKNENYIEYAFIPGWFDEIQVDRVTVKWSKSISPSQVFNATVGNNNIDYTETDSYYIWTTSLGYGQKLETAIKYNLSSFPNIDLNKDYSNSSKPPMKWWIPVIIITCITLGVAGIIILSAISARKAGDGYGYYRGYSGSCHHYYSWWWIFHSGVNKKGDTIAPPKPPVSGTGGSHTSGGHCACACACACAGGGRAGCSRKDFYNSPSMDSIINELEKKDKKQ